MADTKWSQFPSATPASADEVVGLHSGGNVRFTLANIIAYIRQGLETIFVPVTRTINGKPLTVNISLDASDVGAVDTADVGVADGVASLDSTGKVPSSQLPTIPSDAEDITYDPTTSGLTATDVQAAIDEMQGEIGNLPSPPSPSDATPQDLGTAAAGRSADYSRADHVHNKPSAADVGAQPTITASGVLKGNGAGGVSAATPGTDYQAPLTAGTDYATPGQLADKANQAQLATVETGSTASRAYAVGELFCWNGLLYRAKKGISSGGTFTPGTNCEATTMGSEVYSSVARKRTFTVPANGSLDIVNATGQYSYLLFAVNTNAAAAGAWIIMSRSTATASRIIQQLYTPSSPVTSIASRSYGITITNGSSEDLNISIIADTDGFYKP